MILIKSVTLLQNSKHHDATEVDTVHCQLVHLSNAVAGLYLQVIHTVILEQLILFRKKNTDGKNNM